MGYNSQKTMKKSSYVLFLSMLFFLPSCMVTQTSVKNFDQLSGQEYYYAKGKQNYLFWGLLPIGKPNVSTPQEDACQVRTKQSFVDGLVSCLTAGIFSMQTVEIVAKRPEALKKGDIVTYFKGAKACKGTLEAIINSKKCTIRTEDGKLKKINMMNVTK